MPIVDILVTAPSRAARSLPRLFAIYWLPWLMGTLGLVILDAVVEDYLRMGQPPGWARNLVWAPFAAMSYVMLLRFMIDGRPPARPHRQHRHRQGNLDRGPDRRGVVHRRGDDRSRACPDADLDACPGGRALTCEVDDLVGYVIALQFAARLLNAALIACFFGLIVVVVRSGVPDLTRLWRLLHHYPVRLIYVSFLALIAALWLWGLGSLALAWLALDQRRPRG